LGGARGVGKVGCKRGGTPRESVKRKKNTHKIGGGEKGVPPKHKTPNGGKKMPRVKKGQR